MIPTTTVNMNLTPHPPLIRHWYGCCGCGRHPAATTFQPEAK
jgi:hypothetical protein